MKRPDQSFALSCRDRIDSRRWILYKPNDSPETKSIFSWR